MRATIKLGSVTKKIGSGVTPRGGEKVYRTEGTALIRSQNVYDYRFVEDGLVYIDDTEAKRMKGVEIQKNDVLINITGDSVGRCCIVPEKVLPARVNQHVCILRADPAQLNSRYLMYYINEPGNKQRLLNQVHGGTRKALTKGILEAFEITIPSLRTQEKIAEILGSLDDKIELNRRMNETLEQMAMALYKHWFVDFGPFQDGEFVESEMGMIPQGWTVQELGNLVSIQTSSVNPAKNEESQFLHYSIPAYDEQMRPKLEKGLEIKSNKYLIKRNSILVSKLNPETYRIWTVFAEPSQYERICSTEFIVYEPKNENAWAFLNAYFRDDSFKNEFRSHAAGTTGSRQRVAPRKTLEFKLVVPPDSVLEQFNRICSDYYKIQNKNIRENEMLTETRDYLLPRLLSGEIEVRKAEEQVEEVLANA